MTVRYRVLPYMQGSKSAKALAEALGGKVLKLDGSKYVYKDGDVVINWGYTLCAQRIDDMTKHLTYPDSAKIHNWQENRMRGASNKLLFFNNMKESCSEIIPRFWTSKDSIPPDAYPVVCRTVLAGHSGAGIVIASCPSELVAASLYVQYVKKKDEYRVHLGRKNEDPEIIAVQRKARSNSAQNVNWQVRSHNNGFVFVRNNVNPPPCVIEAAVKSFTASSLDFGAVDVIWNEQQEKAYVLEINTAPGLEGQTIQDYATFFKSIND